MKHIQHMIRKGTGRVLVAGMLIMSLMASMLPAYAMTGEVLGPETEGTPSGVVEIGSWDELLGNFASPDDSQVIEIPEMVPGCLKQIIDRIQHRIIMEEQCVPKQEQTAPDKEHTDVVNDLLPVLFRIIGPAKRQISGDHEEQRHADPRRCVDDHQRNEFL